MSPHQDAPGDFEPAQALSRLGDAMWTGQEPSPGLASAWEAAWIACLTDRASWRDRARVEYQNALAHLAGVQPVGAAPPSP